MQEKPKNKAVQQPPSLKDGSAIVFDKDDVIVIDEQAIKEEAEQDETRAYLQDGQAYLRYPDNKALQKNLTREQRRALKRRGIQVD